MPIPEQFIDELVARSEISDVVSSYVHLTRKGNNLWGLCPFHNEKTPSFSVSPDKQIYHCFGCGKGGGGDPLHHGDREPALSRRGAPAGPAGGAGGA